MNNQVQLLSDQVLTRDQEIKRLGVQLEIAKIEQFSGISLGDQNNLSKVGSSVSINDINIAKRRIDQLESHVENIQEYTEGLEKVF